MPLYYVALAFGIVAFPALSQFPVDISAYTVFRNASFTQSLLPSVSRAINPVIWTLTHEMLFYLLVPAIFLMRRFFSLIIIGAALAAYIGNADPSNTFAPFLQLFFLFAIGMTIARYELCPTRLTAELITATAVIFGVLGVGTMWICLAWALALLSTAMSLRNFRASLPIRAMVVVGICSYSLYVWHYMLIEICVPWLSNKGYLQNWPIVTGIGFMAFALVSPS